ncbi:AgmX/PglI C-terminal domain-containing protein [Polyangium aurulentum]|uniref:AgmX/PglI C-terminal domain-containing protein n=1 Tax=Polyangium aurulentum TaxID=2567896 RepID=UPI0010AECBF5|nr:AgmX/PglI C-terminal domain-containing protein [Polyangium aurulentum]UQA59774.1 AgmX/PglI C-terminal domain-containing protein [Polyangium aurulentum]
MERNRNEKDAQAHGITFGALPRPFDPRALFATKPEEPREVPADAPEGSYTYALVKSGPEVPAEECEQKAEAIEIMILWGSSILHVAHLSPPRSFFVGEQDSDFVLPADTLGTARLPVVLVGDDGVARAVVSGSEVALALGERVKIEIGGLTIQVAKVLAGRAVKAAPPVSGKGLPWHGVSLAIHAGLLAAAAFFLPPMGAEDESGISPEDRYFIQHALDVSAEKEVEKKDTPVTDAPGGGASNSGPSSAGDQGKAGTKTNNTAPSRIAFEGPRSNMDPQIARQAALEDARTIGMISLLNSLEAPSAIATRWGTDEAVGNDPKSAFGNMWGDSLEDAAGPGGMHLSDDGDGGGKNGKWIGIDGVRTVGTDPNGPTGFGPRNLKPRDHKPGSPVLRPLAPSAQGALAPELIQRTVRQNFGRFRFCYEQGLRGNPSLAGRVAVRFVIGRDGAVSNVQNGGSDMGDPNVVSCVVRSFYGLSFPAPESGIVTVTYPILFQPGG